MKHSRNLIANSLGLLVVFCANFHAFGIGVSNETNGLRMVIAAQRQEVSSKSIITNSVIRFDDYLLWMPFSTSNDVRLVRPVDLAYFVKFKMTDPNGKEVEKTSVGARCGSKLDKLKTISDTGVYPCIAVGGYKENAELIQVKTFLYRPVDGASIHLTPNDIFQIEMPGIYTMEVQMQMFCPKSNGTNRWDRELIQFSPVSIKVEKQLFNYPPRL
jgi:hypothetical protein